MKYFISILAFVLFFSILWFGVDKQERYECRQWEEQARLYALFVPTSWQVAQCRHYGMELGK